MNLSNESFSTAGLDILSAELAAYCKDNGIEEASADELAIEYAAKAKRDDEDDDGSSAMHADYFAGFVARWDAMVERDVMLTQECGEVSLGNLGNCEDIPGSGGDEDKAEELCDKYESGNLKSVVPNIVLRIGGVEHLLTWDEASILGHALVREASICEFS